MKQPQEVDEPRQLPYGEQERCAAEGRRIGGLGVNSTSKRLARRRL